MSCVAVIGGTGLADLSLTASALESRATPYGDASGDLISGEVAGHRVLFLSRHGNPPVVAAHAVNYRANLWLLQQAGAEQVIAVNTVGGILPQMKPGDVLVPDQIIDYTWGREHTYSNQDDLKHVDFSYPYDRNLSAGLIAAAESEACGLVQAGVQIFRGGTYACTQGPRLETAAEVQRYAREDCAVVGMTAMPEASLARELSLPYACVCLVVNMAAGLADDAAPISLTEMREINRRGMQRIQSLLGVFLHDLPLAD